MQLGRWLRRRCRRFDEHGLKQKCETVADEAETMHHLVDELAMACLKMKALKSRCGGFLSAWVVGTEAAFGIQGQPEVVSGVFL